jgi:hypothetical protein
LFCQKCGASAAEDSQFCSRCGNPFNALSTPLVAQSQPNGNSRRTLGIILAVIIMVVSGLLWFASARETDPRTTRKPQENAADARMQAAIRLCDSAAQAKLYFPNTMEFVGDPKADQSSGFMIEVEREIAAKDKHGMRYRYRYMCSAMSDGKGGIGQVNAELLPTN